MKSPVDSRIKSISSNHSVMILYLILIGLAGGLMLWMNTPWGVGVGYDSFYYLSAADNLLQGNGLSLVDGFGEIVPIIHYPPFYPLALAAGSLVTGYQILPVARFLAYFTFGVNIFLTGWLVHRFTRSSLAGVMGACVALFSFVLIDVHLMAMSEPLFLAVLLVTTLLVTEYLDHKKIWMLVGAAALAGVAYLTRYVGLAAIATGVLALLIFNGRSWKRKVIEAVLFAIVSGMPILVYYLRNWLLTGSTTNRVWLFHPPTRAQLLQGLNTVAAWFLPQSLPFGLKMLLLGGFLVFLFTIFVLWFASRGRQRFAGGQHFYGLRFTGILIIFDALYLLLLAASLTFFDASTRLNDRILSPVYLTGIIGSFILAWNGLSIEGSLTKKFLAISFVLLFAAFNLRGSAALLRETRKEGEGFTGKVWQTSETVSLVDQLPAGTLLYSNEAFPIYFLTGRPANWIPENYDPVKGEQAGDYDEKIEKMKETILRSSGALVIFDSITQANVYAPVDMLAEGLVLWKDTADGAIYLSP